MTNPTDEALKALEALKRITSRAWADAGPDAESGVIRDSQAIKAVLMASLSPHGERGFNPTHRHKKRGSEYQIVGDVIMQCEEFTAIDDKRLILYRDKEGRYWCRPPAEFNDGRFEDMLSAAPSREPQEVDVEALKLKSFTHLNTMFFGKEFTDRDVVDATINFLTTNGYRITK